MMQKFFQGYIQKLQQITTWLKINRGLTEDNSGEVEYCASKHPKTSFPKRAIIMVTPLINWIVSLFQKETHDSCDLQQDVASNSYSINRLKMKVETQCEEL